MLLYIINRRIITNKIAVIVIIFFLTIVFNSYSAPPENNPSDPCSNHYLCQSFVNTKSYATFTLNNCDKLPPLKVKIVLNKKINKNSFLPLWKV